MKTSNQKDNLFSKYKFHPSSIGLLMTNLNTITEKQLQELEKLEKRVVSGPPLTDKMAVDLQALRAKADNQVTALSDLPKGAISKLDEIYWEVVWKRTQIIDTKYMEKGSIMEQDSLDMLSRVDNFFYHKNDKYHSNELLTGCPDTFTETKVIDTKSPWDYLTFEKAEMTKLYEWQIKGYCWILGKWDGELVYCLVNAPGSMVTKAIEKKWYYYNQPDQNNDWWIGVVQQIERNMIYDFRKFRKDNPGADLETKVDDFTVPEEMRIKRFDVALTDWDINVMKIRLRVCRDYLMDRYDREFVSSD